MLFVFIYIMGAIVTNDRVSAESIVSQAVATATEKYLIQGTLTPEDIPPGLLGFGIYGLTNQANFRFGTAPDKLPSNMRGVGGLMRYSNEGIIQLVRPLGGSAFDAFEYGATTARRFRNGRVSNSDSFYDATQTRRWESSGEGKATLYAIYDTTGLLLKKRMRDTVLVLAGILGTILTGSVFMLYRRRFYERKEREDQRWKAYLCDAAGTLAHGIKNPLAVLRIQQAILAKAVPEKLVPSIDVIGEEISSISSLTDRIGALIRDPVGNPETVDLCSLARDCTQQLPYPIKISSPPYPCTVSVDRSHASFVLITLLENAQDCMNKGEESASAGVSSSIELSIERRFRFIVVRVLDRGKGIDSEDKDRVFNPFTTSKIHGLGIDLSVAQKYIACAGGTITAHDRPGGGTIFVVKLPKLHRSGFTKRQ